jgi:hypothetical protein
MLTCSFQAEEQLLAMEAAHLQSWSHREEAVSGAVKAVVEPLRDALLQVRHDVAGVAIGLSKCGLMSEQAAVLAVQLALQRDVQSTPIPISLEKVGACFAKARYAILAAGRWSIVSG